MTRWRPHSGQPNLGNVLLHPVVVAVDAIAPDVALLRDEAPGLRHGDARRRRQSIAYESLLEPDGNVTHHQVERHSAFSLSVTALLPAMTRRESRSGTVQGWASSGVTVRRRPADPNRRTAGRRKNDKARKDGAAEEECRSADARRSGGPVGSCSPFALLLLVSSLLLLRCHVRILQQLRSRVGPRPAAYHCRAASPCCARPAAP